MQLNWLRSCVLWMSLLLRLCLRFNLIWFGQINWLILNFKVFLIARPTTPVPVWNHAILCFVSIFLFFSMDQLFGRHENALCSFLIFFLAVYAVVKRYPKTCCFRRFSRSTKIYHRLFVKSAEIFDRYSSLWRTCLVTIRESWWDFFYPTRLIFEVPFHRHLEMEILEFQLNSCKMCWYWTSRWQ